jgi:hypothetical protein
MARKATELRPVMTRIPEGLRRRLERAASNNDRSMNAEIMSRLEESFEHESLIPILNAMVLKEARAGTVVAGWLAQELRKQGLGESAVNKIADLVKAYMGKELAS